MRLLIAPTAYKGTLSPLRAAQIIASSLASHAGGAATDLCPIADGGTGWLEVWHYHFPQAQRQPTTVPDALGRPQSAEWLLLPTGTAVLESAQAIGLHLLRPEEYAPLEATSEGVGELLQHAAAHPAVRALWLGLGGVATTDAGAGALRALGFKLLDAQGKPIPPNGQGLLHLHTFEPPDSVPLQGKPLTLCADVQNPLLDAARVYGPQKGATPEQVALLERALARFAAVVQHTLGIDLLTMPGSGAAGGLAGGLHAGLHAPVVSGIRWLLQHIGWETRLAQADALITGEGQVDAQTLMGKGVGVLIQQAVAQGKPVIVIAGRKGTGWESLADLPGVKVYACTELAPHLSPEEALAATVRTAV